MSGRLNGKVAIITGGSTGIGKGIAKIFAGEGAKVAICARDEKMLADALKEISSESVIAVKCDVTKSADVKNLIDTTIENFGKLNVLVNNAGKNPVRQFTIEDATEEEWDQFQAINAKGSFFASKYAATIPAMPEPTTTIFSLAIITYQIVIIFFQFVFYKFI